MTKNGKPESSRQTAHVPRGTHDAQRTGPSGSTAEIFGA